MSAYNDEQSVDQTLSLAGARPAVPRDPRLLEAERAEYDARQAQEQAEAAKAAANDAAAKAAAAQANLEKTRAELEAAREEAKAKARAAALQVRMEHDEQAQFDDEARAQARAARDERLGTVHAVDDVEPEVVTVVKNSTDGFFGSLGLFLVRVICAGFTGIVGWEALVNRPAVVGTLTYLRLSESLAGIAAPIIGIVLMIVAAILVFGALTRLVSLILAGFTGAFLAFFRFGPFSPFREGHFGFYGDREVLLAALYLVLVLLGAGGWSIDAGMRRRKQRSEEI